MYFVKYTNGPEMYFIKYRTPHSIKQRIIRAAATFVILFQDTLIHYITDVIKGCVRGAFTDFRPLTGSQFAKESVKLHINDLSLALIYP